MKIYNLARLNINFVDASLPQSLGHRNPFLDGYK
jgi:hypothetical protein